VKKVVLFGAGLVSPPLIRYLLDGGFHLTVASLPGSGARKLVDGHQNARVLPLDVNDHDALHKQVAAADVAVSLLPAAFHPQVARACLDCGVPMVTTSYVSPEMHALDAEARDKGVLLLNEMGVDPGIDHMSAMQVIHAEQAKGATLVGFSSWCGGLPAPEANDNAFGYKVSWSPRAVLLAARSSARYLKDGQVVDVTPEKLFADPAAVAIPDIGTLEGYANRDSVSYLDTYGFDKGQVRNMFRGTLRNQGHCQLRTHLAQLGLFDDEVEHDLTHRSGKALLETLFGAPLEETIPGRLGVTAAQSPLGAMKHIGLLSDSPIGLDKGTLLDIMAHRMHEDLAFKPGERDMVVMRHDLTFQPQGGQRRERITAIMVDFGIPNGDSSMARTVALPAAIGTRMVLEGAIELRGVHIPIEPAIYKPVLAELKKLEISFSESRATLD
jgi:saccharopine dehydrogenase-like NADP-dependent oxidoreductase